MEDILDLCMEPPDERRPVVSFDETRTQLIGEARVAVAQGPGRAERIEYEYRRNSTANIARINWMFDAAGARRKLGKLYPEPVPAAQAA